MSTQREIVCATAPVILTFLLLMVTVRTVPGAQQSIQSAKQGAYTTAQAERGNEEYRKNCATCHKDDMSGTTEAPPLVGEKFVTAWQDSSVGDLYDLVRSTMPYDQPNSLRPEAYIDIVAAMLQRNNYRAGTDELPVDIALLKSLTLK